jgi:Holliday junction resolvasome RuvABC endonuclease subunit
VAIVRILGLDPGTASFGWDVLEGDTTLGKVLKPMMAFGLWKTEKWADKALGIAFSNRERIDMQVGRVVEAIREHQVTHVVMEDFVYMGGRGDVPSAMVALIESIRIACRTLGVPCEIFTNGHWKQILLKCRTANKNQTSHYLTHEKALKLDAAYLKANDPGYHIRDAIGLAYCRFKYLVGVEHHDGSATLGDHGHRQNGTGKAVPAPKGERGARNPGGTAVAGGKRRRIGRPEVRRK